MAAMDPNPKNFPILSYVLAHIPPNLSFKVPSSQRAPPADPFDIEQPPSPFVPTRPPGAGDDDPSFDLSENMPGLKDPALLAAMSRAVADVASSRSALLSLGPRPDHESVDSARSLLASSPESPLPASITDACRTVINLEEMHEAYESLIAEAEERLNTIYRAAMEGVGEDVPDNGGGKFEEQEQVDEEVVSILKRAENGKVTVERVDLADRQLQHLPEAFGRIKTLLYLNVSSNLLEVIPDAVGALENLEELHLASNHLLSLPDTLGLLSKLKILNVSGNKLKALPDSISNCRSLVELDASYNGLTYLPTHIGHEMANLQKLDVHLNKLRSLPTSICEMRSLHYLDAHFNELRGLPAAFGKLTNLEVLDISSNFSDMKELPASFGDLLNLREVDLSNNQIHALPDAFGRLDKLEKLNLDENPLVLPPKDVVNNGVGAVMEYMTKHWLNILLEAEEKSISAENTPKAGWLTRSISSLSTWVSDISGNVQDYLGTSEKSEKDEFLNQQF